MNKLIIIGNGFDLSHGLKTRYIDFLLWYLNNAFMELAEKCRYNDELIELICNYRIPVKEFKSIFDFRNHLKENKEIVIKYKYQFFERLLTQLDNPNWVDIESKYYSFLLILYRRLEKANIDNHSAVDRDLDALNDCFDIIKAKLNEYLSIIESNSIKQNKEIKEHFLSIIGEVPNGKPNDMHILNFNYTSTIEIYKEHFDSINYEINYIHGKLDDKKNPIIFGYGDEMDTYYEKIERLNLNGFLKNFKSFGYFKTSNYQNFSRFIDTFPFRVYVFGHSCGLSDRILLNSIVEHKNCSSIKLFYYQKNEFDDDYFEKTQELSRHFKSNSKGLMRNIIIPKSDSDPLIKYKLM